MKKDVFEGVSLPFGSDNTLKATEMDSLDRFFIG
jgi:hypothetical protein